MNYYNEISQGYEELYKEEQIKKLNFIKEFLERLKIEIKDTDKLLDVGCGTGLTTRFWPSNNKTGIDPAEKLIEKARQKDKKIDYLIAPAEKIPFDDNTFDVITSITAIQNFQDIEKGLIEIKRTAKNIVILSFLKESTKKDKILNTIKNLFRIEKITNETKDVVVICYK